MIMVRAFVMSMVNPTVKLCVGPGKGGPHGPYHQSERLDLYHSYANKLLDVRGFSPDIILYKPQINMFVSLAMPIDAFVHQINCPPKEKS